MATRNVTITVNGEAYTRDVEPRLLLVHLLRDVLDLTGTHIGCDTSNCGACTVLLDGRSIKSCTLLAVQAHGKAITTIEGWRRTANSILCKRVLRKNTACSAASAPPA